jgi:hypothetical protein
MHLRLSKYPLRTLTAAGAEVVGFLLLLCVDLDVIVVQSVLRHLALAVKAGHDFTGTMRMGDWA